VYDKGLIGEDLISSAKIDLKKYMNQVHKSKTGKNIPREWIALRNL